MKNILLAIVYSLAIPFIASAQDFSTYGVVTNDELAIKECAFDKEADAIVLLDEAVANDDDDYNLIEWRHTRIKILKESGFSYADINIPFYRKDNKQVISEVEAMVTNLNEDGSVEVAKVDKKSFYRKDKNQYWGEFIFTFPKVKIGSIIEYKYRKVSNSYYFLDDWHFHSYLPSVKSTFTLYVPPKLELTYQVVKSEDFPIKVKRDEGNASVYFEMNNLPGIGDEPYMDARKDYIQKLSFQISGVNRNNTGMQKTNSTWTEVINEYLSASYFGTQLRKNLSGTDAFVDEVKKISSDVDKLRTVYNYVKSNMSWNGFTGRATDGIKDAWNKKTGTNGEINLILVNLLRDADVVAYPILVSERWHGKVRTNYPFIDQFNTVYACAEANGKKYYLNAASKNTPPHMPPADVLNTTGLIIDRKNGGLLTITSNDLMFDENVSQLITVDKGGKFTGEVTVNSNAYARVEKLEFLKDKGNQRFINQFYKSDDFAIDSFTCNNRENDSLALEQNIRFSGKLKATNGDYYFLALNNFMGFKSNPFIAEKRFSDVNFGYKRKINSYCYVQLPPGFMPDELPKPVRMATPDKNISFSRNVEYDKAENSVTIMFTFNFEKSTYDVNEYQILHQVYKKMFGFLNEPLVLKTK